MGNTYPFTEADWAHTLDLAEDTGLDALALNLGPEPWQMKQAQVAYNLATNRIVSPVLGRRPVRLFFSLDMNVLVHDEMKDANVLAVRLARLMETKAQFQYEGKAVLTTFGGHDAKWGGRGWPGFLEILHARMSTKPMFWPCFFMPPDNILAREYVDGVFAWNNAWPIFNGRVGITEEDITFINSPKPYMAAVSPLFFTHYGTTGEWAFSKNFIYRSDDLLYASRWAGLLSHQQQPNIIHVTSWNDYGESHNIAPVLGAEPGSSNWTKGMDHEAFREMTRYFIHRWRNHAPEVYSDELTLWLWYRTHPAAAIASDDAVGPPDHKDVAQDLLNIVLLVPKTLDKPQVEITIGPLHTSNDRTIPLMPGRMNSFKVPFVPGHVRVTVKSSAGTHLRVWGRDIDEAEDVKQYNFNMWTGSWKVLV